MRTLKPEEIEVKIKQVFQKGAVALLYKTARVDMAILDETYGPENWTNEYKDIDGVLYCGIGVRKNENKPFVWKWSNGIESRQDGDGNEVKGEASDALKRAGFLVGIGRELYTAPFTFLKVPTQKNEKGKYELENKTARFYVSEIEYDNGKITRLVIVDNFGEVVFTFGQTKTGDDAPYHNDIAGIKKTVLGKEGLPWEDELPAKKPLKQPDGMVDDAMINDIWASAAQKGYSDEDVQKVIVKIFQKEYVEDLTVAEGNTLLKQIKGA